ncbi:MAG: hypothetical protein K2F87_05465 [Muribaculaceae bacterium]|nr:hypothetical protein [Muribaculaceae bacterium]
MATIDDITGGSATPPSRTDKPTQISPATVATDATKIAGMPGDAAVAPKLDIETPQMSYVDMYRLMNPHRPETAEQRAKREKREKSEAVLAAVGDGISALSNLFMTSRYAPNAYDPSKGMSATTKARLDRLRQEREAKSKEYFDGYMRAKAMDEAKDREDRNWRHTIEREKIADKRYEIQEAREKALADLNEKLKAHQISAAEWEAEAKRIKAQYAEENEKLDQDYKRAGIKQREAATGASNASATASYAKANYYNNGGGKHGPTLQLEDEEPMHFDDDKDYDRAVMRLAPDYGVQTSVVEITEYDSLSGKPKKQRTVARPVKDIAADIEREAAKRKKANPKNNQSDGKGASAKSKVSIHGNK